MKLKDFLRINDLNYREFSEMVGTSLFTLNGIINKKRMPSMKLAMKIEQKTMKKVTLYDWFELHNENEGKNNQNKDKKNSKKE